MRQSMRWAALLPMVVLLAACTGASPVIEVGEPAPEIRLADVSGQKFTLEEMKGQIVLLNFWALWCEPCKAEMPDFQAALDRYGSAGFAVVTVDLGDPADDVRAYIGEKGYSFIALVDPKLTLRKSYDTRILPLSLLIDREGLVRNQRVTPFERGDLTRRIEELLGSPIAHATGTPTVPAGDTPAPTPVPSQTPSPTARPSLTPSPTRSPQPSATPLPSPSRPAGRATTKPPATRAATHTPTNTPTSTEPLPTPTNTWVPSPTDTPRPAATHTPMPSPTATPTPTETTVPLVYGVSLGGETDKTAYPEVWVEFLGELVNTGNVTDTFLVGLQIQPRGWDAKYCIGPACYDYTVPSMPVTVPADGHQAVSVKLKPPPDAQEGDFRMGRLRATSQSDPGVTADWQVKATVDIP